MSFQIPLVEPLIVTAGDRIQWKKHLSDFPAGTWTLTYYFRGNSAQAQFDVAAVADGTTHSIDISPTTSADYIPADYTWSAYVSTSGDRKPIGSGRLTVLPDPSTITTPFDGRSHARRVRDSLRLVIEGKATSDVQKYVMQAVGRAVDRMTVDDILKFLNYYEGLVQAEEAQEAADRGEGSGRNIYIQFNK